MRHFSIGERGTFTAATMALLGPGSFFFSPPAADVRWRWNEEGSSKARPRLPRGAVSTDGEPAGRSETSRAEDDTAEGGGDLRLESDGELAWVGWFVGLFSAIGMISLVVWLITALGWL